jgi:hypothetical protein
METISSPKLLDLKKKCLKGNKGLDGVMENRRLVICQERKQGLTRTDPEVKMSAVTTKPYI